jgi:ribosomal protein S18 acetylase RimI-like enzyme
MLFVEPHAATVGSGMWRVHPDHAGRGIGTWILGYVERRSREHPEVTTIRLGVEEEDVAGHRLLAEHGYERVRTSFDMGVSLRGDEVAPPTPDGITVRWYEPGEEPDLWRIEVEAFRDHWDHVEDQTYESFVADWFEDPERPPRVLVGELDGVAQGVTAWVVDHGVPYIYSVAVLREARGRGVATAMLERVKEIVATEGAEELTLSVDATNPTGAVRAYEKVGMVVNRSVAAFEKGLA